MRKLAGITLLVCLAAAHAWAGPATTWQPTYWRYVHPDARLLVGLEWRKLVNSQMGEKLRGQLDHSSVRLASLKGLDFTKDLERVFVSSPGEHADGQPRVVIALSGQFNLPAIRKTVTAEGARPSRYKTVELLVPNAKDPADLCLALINSQTLLLGDRQSVQAAIDQRWRSVPSDSAILQRASALAAEYELWFVADAPVMELLGKQGPHTQFPFLTDVTGMEAGVSLSQGLAIRLDLESKSEESARALVASLRTVLSVIAGQQKLPAVAGIMQKLQLNAVNTTARIAFWADREELEKHFPTTGPGAPATTLAARPAVKGITVAAAHPVPAAPLPAPPPAPAAAPVPPPPPPPPQVIRVFNAEGGTREIRLPELPNP